MILVGLALRIFVSIDIELHPWDERYHALVAKNLIDNALFPRLYNSAVLPYNYQDWTSNYVWLHKQPIPLWVMSMSIKLFGVSSFSVRIPSIILSTLGIFLMYRIAKFLFNDRVAYFSTFLFAINGLILEITAGRTATDHVDLFFLVLIMFAVWAAGMSTKLRPNLFTFLSAAFIGLAILSKWMPALIVIPIWWLLHLRAKTRMRSRIMGLLIMVITISMIVLPWQIYIYSNFPLEAKWESLSNFKHLTETLDNQGGSFFYHFDKMRINYGELIYIPVFWLIWVTWKERSLKHIVLLIWILIPYLFFSFAKTKMQAYTLFCAPPLFMSVGLFFFWMKEHWENKPKLKYFSYAFLCLTILLALRFSFERIKPYDTLTKRHANQIWVNNMRSLEDLPETTLIFNESHPIETMYFSGKISYNYVPEIDKLIELKSNGYYLVLNTEHVDQSLADLSIWDYKYSW